MMGLPYMIPWQVFLENMGYKAKFLVLPLIMLQIIKVP